MFIYVFIQQKSGDGLLRMALMVKPALTGKEMMLSFGVTMLWFQTAKIEQLTVQVSLGKVLKIQEFFVNSKDFNQNSKPKKFNIENRCWKPLLKTNSTTIIIPKHGIELNLIDFEKFC